MSSNYNIVRTIFENVFQRVVECKEIDTGKLFYSNVITNPKVINLINVEEINKLSSNIIDCYKTEDRIYIFTKLLKNEYRSIKEYVGDKLTLKQQFNLTKNIIELSSDIFNMKDVVQQKILDLDRIYIDESNDLIVDLNLVFEQEYDISDNETLKRMGNMIHFIFSGNEIVDYNISEMIPPDILKIIVRCLTREYKHPKDALSELIASPIYGMIFLNSFDKKDGKEQKEKKEQKKNISEEKEIVENNINSDKLGKIMNESLEDTYYENDDLNEFDNEKEDSVYNIFLNDNNPKPIKNKNKKNFLNKDLKRAVVSIFIVILVLFVGSKFVNNFKTEEPASSEENAKNEEKIKFTNSTEEETNDPTNEGEISDSTSMYLNDDLLKNVGYTGAVAEVDSNIYVEGKNSLLVKNDVDETIKVLFATVDFTDEKFSYMLKQQIGVSAKVKSENDVTATIVIEAYKDGQLTANFHTKLEIFNDLWSQLTVPINVTSADFLNIYVEYSGINKVWFDSIYIDVIK